MLVGDEATFGAEYEILEASSAVGPWGRFCFRIGGSRVGSFRDPCSIGAVLVAVADVLRLRGYRREPSLMACRDVDLFWRIDDALYADTGQSHAQIALDSAYYSRFCIRPEYEPFDGWKVYLVEDDTSGRILWRHYSEPRETVHELRVRAGAVDAVLKEFTTLVDSAYPAPGDVD